MKKFQIVIVALLALFALGLTGVSQTNAGGGNACGVNQVQIALANPVGVRAEPWSQSSITGDFSGTVFQWVAVEEQSSGYCYVRLTDSLGQIGWALISELQSVSNLSPTASPTPNTGGNVVLATSTPNFSPANPTFTPSAPGPTATPIVFGPPNTDSITVRGEGATFSQGSVLSVPYGSLVSQWDGVVGGTRETVLRLCLTNSCVVDTSIGAGDWRYYTYLDGNAVDEATLRSWIGSQMYRFTFSNQIQDFNGNVVWTRP